MTGLDTRLAPIKAFILEKKEFSYKDIQDKFNKSQQSVYKILDTIEARSTLTDKPFKFVRLEGIDKMIVKEV